MKYKKVKDEKLTRLTKKLNRMFKSQGRDVLARFYGSQMNHDMPMTWALEFTRELSQTEMARTEKMVKRYMGRTWYVLDRWHLQYSFISRKQFEKSMEILQIGIMHSSAEAALEDLESWFQEYAHPRLTAEECANQMQNLDFIKDWMDTSLKLITEGSK